MGLFDQRDNKVRVSLWVGAKELAEIDRMARKYGTTRSVITRYTLERELSDVEHEIDAERARRGLPPVVEKTDVPDDRRQ